VDRVRDVEDNFRAVAAVSPTEDAVVAAAQTEAEVALPPHEHWKQHHERQLLSDDHRIDGCTTDANCQHAPTPVIFLTSNLPIERETQSACGSGRPHLWTIYMRRRTRCTLRMMVCFSSWLCCIATGLWFRMDLKSMYYHGRYGLGLQVGVSAIPALAIRASFGLV